MDIRTKTTGYDVTPDVSTYLDERLNTIEKSLGAHGDSARCEVDLGRDTGHAKNGNVWFAEINIVGDRFALHAKSEAESINAAIDEVRDEIIRQLRKSRQLHRRVFRRGGAMVKRILRLGDEN